MIESPQLDNTLPNIILASKSPRRADLLKQIGLEFEVYPSEIEEPQITTSPAIAVQELARAKAKAVAAKFGAGIVLGADTVVVIDGQPIGKPENDAHAIEILTRLSGNRHEVITGVALIDIERKNEVVWSEKTAVYFRKLRQSEILAYVRSGESSDKAGAYGIQGQAGTFVEGIEGCYFNVVGLPLASLTVQLWRLLEDDPKQ
ncbi:septum formation inhibitor Maf [Candidatus Poribacteria bacterium]|nr:septum formation inhibitor Maf [Candidatus Poribacteria bacterium]